MPRPRQLELIPWFNPLGERIGPEFFRELPSAPGVYRMLSRDAEVLYVGSSRNLRSRVASYRSISPARHARRLCRLVHAARAIHIEPTDTEAQARALEASWIRHYRPRFNRAMNGPIETIWIGLRFDVGGGTLSTYWSHTGQSRSAWAAGATAWGPFAHRRPVFWIHSLRRTLWWAAAGELDLRSVPTELLCRDRPRPDFTQSCPFDGPRDSAEAFVETLLAEAANRLPRLLERPWNRPLLEFWEHDRDVLATFLPGAENALRAR